MKIKRNWLYVNESVVTVSVVLACLFLILAFVFLFVKIDGHDNLGSIFLNISMLIVLVNSITHLSAQGVEIDEENKTICFASDRGRRFDATKISRIAKYVNRKGKVKYVTIHVDGSGYYDLRISDIHYPDFIERIRRVSPDVQEATYKD